MAGIANSFVEQSFTANGTTDWLAVDSAPGLWNGRNWGIVYIEGTGDSNANIMIEVKPTTGSSSVIISQCDALSEAIAITGTVRTTVADYNITRGMEVRATVSDYTGTGSINVRVDLGIS